MIELNKKIVPPPDVKSYFFVKMALLVTLLSFPFSVFGGFWGMFLILLLFLGLPILIYLLIDINNVSFVVEEKKITINSGIIIKNSKSIPFANVHNVVISSGSVAKLFKVSRIDIWTASQSQTSASNGVEHKPDGSLILKSEASIWLQKFILDNR